MLTAAGTYNGLSGDAAATAPLDTQVITAVLRLGCSGVAAGEPQGEAGAAAVCLPAERIADVVKASLDDGARIDGRSLVCKHPYLHNTLTCHSRACTNA